MKTKAAPHIVEATASLLSTNPEMTNPELLRRLTARLGEEEMRSILVTRFQRSVRDPAIRLLQDRARNGDPESEASPPSGAKGGRGAAPRDRRRESTPARAARHAGGPRPPLTDLLRTVDEAIERAFRLGAEAESPLEIIEARRAVDRLRLETDRALSGGS